ncbi:MAG: hypothetical protein RLZZ393_2074 [Pseudomonadota bacterium]
MFSRSAFVLGTAFALSAGAAYAHHSFAMFDNAKEQTIEGEVKDFQWTNPHIWIQVNVKGSDGKLTEYSIEGGSPNGLKRQGWTKKSINAGDKIVLKMHPLKDGTPGGSFMSAQVNGKTLGRNVAEEYPQGQAPAAK